MTRHACTGRQVRDVVSREKGWLRMNITTTFRQMDGTSAVKTYAQNKVSKLQKFLRQAMRADVTLSVEGKEHVAEVHLKAGATHLHGSERSEDMYASIDLVVDKLESQIRSINGARTNRKRQRVRAVDLANGRTRS
jgi:putative sigma-54 modulation protein